MTPTPTARVTPGPWTLETNNTEGDKFQEYPYTLLAPSRPIADIVWVNGTRLEIPAINARFIEAAVNAIFALNPSDPLAAAQHLEELVRAAQRLLTSTNPEDYLEATNDLNRLVSRVLGTSA